MAISWKTGQKENSKMSDKMIGIVGGVGSYAGIDLIRKIYDLTDATCDQEHLPVSMLSAPHKIVDRTGYLLGEVDINPGIAIAEIISTLVSNGAEVIGIPCNTAHAPSIFDVIMNNIPSSCKLVHLVEEVGEYLCKNHPKIRLVGILGTTGTITEKIYPNILKKYEIEAIQPSCEIQSLFVHPSIYDKNYGIKAFSNPVNQKAKSDLVTAASYLSRKGAQVVILGCTEMPLAVTEERIDNSIIIDATSVLASALIRESRNTNCVNHTPC